MTEQLNAQLVLKNTDKITALAEALDSATMMITKINAIGETDPKMPNGKSAKERTGYQNIGNTVGLDSDLVMRDVMKKNGEMTLVYEKLKKTSIFEEQCVHAQLVLVMFKTYQVECAVDRFVIPLTYHYWGRENFGSTMRLLNRAAANMTPRQICGAVRTIAELLSLASVAGHANLDLLRALLVVTMV